MTWLIIVLLTGILVGGSLGLLGAWLALDFKSDEEDPSGFSRGRVLVKVSRPIRAKYSRRRA